MKNEKWGNGRTAIMKLRALPGPIFHSAFIILHF